MEFNHWGLLTLLKHTHKVKKVIFVTVWDKEMKRVRKDSLME